jgi:hypothetical protein
MNFTIILCNGYIKFLGIRFDQWPHPWITAEQLTCLVSCCEDDVTASPIELLHPGKIHTAVKYFANLLVYSLEHKTYAFIFDLFDNSKNLLKFAPTADKPNQLKAYGHLRRQNRLLDRIEASCRFECTRMALGCKGSADNIAQILPWIMIIGL